MKKNNVEDKVNKYYVVIGSICIAIVILFLLLSISETAKQYLVEQGILEYTEITTGYIIKDEKTIEKDQSKIIVPVIAEGSRVSKKDIIATYKGEEYQNYEENLSAMDKEILELMQDLPTVYSSEVDTIEESIYDLVKESIGETSYNKMQEFKQKINNNISKRANIIGSLSPSGAQIKKLINKRNKYEAEAKKSTDNILAPMPGIVLYATDGLESKLCSSNINKLDYNTIQEYVNNRQADNTKIKVVNNYEAYVVLKSDKENIEYMAEGSKYRLRLIEQENYEILASLEKIVETEEGIEVYFKMTNGIEHIADLREVEIEIVWNYANGLIIPKEALSKYENKDVNYVSIIQYGQNVNIPVKIVVENDNYILVDNYTEEELIKLDLSTEYNLTLYDRIIVKNKK